METDTIGPAGSLSDDGGGVFAGAYPEETPAVSGGGGKKKKGKSTRWNIPQNALEMLERVFTEDKFPSVDLRKQLADNLKVTPRQVQVWFQNKRQRSVKPPVKGAQSDLLMLSNSVRAAPRPPVACLTRRPARSAPCAPLRASRRAGSHAIARCILPPPLI